MYSRNNALYLLKLYKASLFRRLPNLYFANKTKIIDSPNLFFKYTKILTNCIGIYTGNQDKTLQTIIPIIDDIFTQRANFFSGQQQMLT
jgi:hypothetical protein